MAANVQGNPKLLPKPPAALCVGLPPWSPLPSPPSGPGSDNDVLFSDQTMPHLGSSVLLLTSARLPPRSLGCRTRSSKDPKSAGKNLMERRSWTYSKRAPRTTTALRRYYLSGLGQGKKARTKEAQKRKRKKARTKEAQKRKRRAMQQRLLQQ